MNRSSHLTDLEEQYGAHNYHPLPVVIAEGEGAWVTDTEGNRYLDWLAAYSAVNFGHRHPRLTAAAHAQLDRITLASRAFRTDTLGPFLEGLAALTGKESVLPMNTGAEAVETAVKAARKWGYERKGIAADRARIAVFDGNFHGRTTTIVGFSSDPGSRDGFGPFDGGFDSVPYGDIDALAAAIGPETAAVLLEPVQGEAGVIVPPAGWLAEVRRLCDEQHVLMIADEIQSGLGRTGHTFACDREDVTPDVYLLGKALGGGIVPLSAVACDREVMDVFTPGTHGSTFGGNPLAAAVGTEVVAMLATGEWQQRARDLGRYLEGALAGLDKSRVDEIRVCGLWAGVDLAETAPSAREVCERLLRLGVLAKETHQRTVRIAPPLVIEPEEIDRGVAALAEAIG
ncbi:ornithine--oxo-acid transaminase [Glycomyces algeriensis]|uniref:ornithine aminotransferase n=1 Tax=Glycomyces algeriensis TaxID=256037 RepID=A0A9W6LH86_9ACTN|nr:ornithine--oxo-acid transaminase [Glycomyces algeriensis]MDA1364632.1 ornithine--oxo-acid transaminase [Glycomyces algeriensis]MDR7350669.1 ornithine--oxo-acid transaminase [Glycomyces algeriensis]GLI43378.1 ornithine--oxo-acid transaminase [Glycomyces algeriensis]